MRLSERSMVSAGRTVGELASINTAGAILGSLAAGFLLLETLGLWSSIWLVAALYLVAAAATAGARTLRAAGLAGALGAAVLAFTVDFDVLRGEAADGSVEQIVEAWEGPDGTVAVTRHGDGDLRLRVNSSYNLGTSASAPNERLQGQIPALLHADPRSIFFLGLGTGITAGGAVSFPFEEIVVCEISPDVIRASREHFGPWLRGLFEDPRVRVIPEDGRTWLSANDTRYDLIVGDIFLSFKAGVGSLYTREHFATVRDRLQPGGRFVQWIPVFDTSVPEFEVLVRTMQEVFPSVTLWRRSFSPVFPVYALVGSLDAAPLDMEALQSRLDLLRRDPDLDPRTWILHLPLAAYVANLDQLAGRFAHAPLNTDDRTWLEYSAPVTERNSKGNRTTPVLAWEPLLRFCEELQAGAPADVDPFLGDAGAAERAQVPAGTAFYGHEVMRRLGRTAEAERYLARYQAFIAP
jgi:spermidine synthase